MIPTLLDPVLSVPVRPGYNLQHLPRGIPRVGMVEIAHFVAANLRDGSAFCGQDRDAGHHGLQHGEAEPLKVAVVFAVGEKDPVDAGGNPRHGQKVLAQVGFRAADLAGNEKKGVDPDSQYFFIRRRFF